MHAVAIRRVHRFMVRADVVRSEHAFLNERSKDFQTVE